MRIPLHIQPNREMLLVIDFEQTPRGFEDCLEKSHFFSRLFGDMAYGEYGTPDVSTLAGNESAQIYRWRMLDERRICMRFTNPAYQMNNRYLVINVTPAGPLQDAFRLLSQTTVPDVEFRLNIEDDDGEPLVTDIYGIDISNI